MSKTIRILSLLFLLPLLALAEGNYQFRYINTANGLSNNSVSSVLVDSEGYLWVGTQSGLNRYDGYEVICVSDIFPEIPLNNVNMMTEGGDGLVWIECANKYSLYDVNKHIFSSAADSLLRSLGISPKAYYRVKATKEHLWVMQKGEMHCYNYGTKSLVSWKVPELTMDDFYSRGSAVTSDGIYISFSHKVWHFSSVTGQLKCLKLPEYNTEKNDLFATFIDRDETVWIYSILTDMVCKYRVGGKIVRERVQLVPEGKYSDNNAIRDILDDGKGNVWIATDHAGIFVYKKQNESIINIHHDKASIHSLSSDNVTSLICDRQGTIWAGHYKTGVSYITTSSDIFLNQGQQYGDVTTLEYDTHGNLWIGTDGDGLFVQYPDGTYQKTSVPNINISDIKADKDGTVWVGTYNHGLFHMRSATGYEYFSVRDGSILSDNVWKIMDDGRGNIWCTSAMSMLYKFDKKTHRSTIVKDDNGENIVGYSLAKGGDKLFVGTVYGLWIFDLKSGGKKWLLGNEAGTKNFLSRMIISQHFDSRRNILLLGHVEGATVYDLQNDSIYHLTHQLGGASVRIRSILADREGDYWVSTAKGLSRVSINRQGTSLRIGVQNYTTREGLQTVDLNESSCALSSQGKLLFGCINGFLQVDPRPITKSSLPDGAPIISDIFVGEEWMSPKCQSISLAHDEANIIVKYFIGRLNNANRIRYAYILRGAMSDWAYTDENRISLVGLSPGRYTLLIAACGSDGTRGEVRELDITVRPPFYLSWWMMGIYLVLACAIGYYVFRRYHLRQKERLEKEKEELEHRKQTQLADMKLKFFTNISHDLRTPLTLIISPLESIISRVERGESMEQSLPMLKNMRKNAQLLYSQVTSLLDFRRLDVGVETLQLDTSDIVAQLASISLSFHDYAQEKGIHFSFTSSRESFLMSYDKKKMEKIVYNLLSNAFKYTPKDGDIALSFYQNEDGAVIEVADTGCGISDEDKRNIFTRFYQVKSNDSSLTGSGIGLHIANEYVALHEGTIGVRDNKPQGSVFCVEIPIREAEALALSASSEASVEMKDSISDDNNEQELPSILVVDDNEDMLLFISSSLQSSYNVLTATDGQEALSVLGTNVISLVVSDVMMPVMDGLELCRRMKSDINMSHIPIILLTARTTEENQLEGLQLGADDYVMKPFNMDVLSLRIAKFMEWAQASHRQFRQKMEVSPSEITITPLDEQFIQNAIKIVEEHIADSEFTVESLGRAVGMSRSNLYKKLMAITGQGPAEFIRTLRIKRGKALLEKSQMQVTEIAYMVGFNSLKSFTTNFKAEYGITPTEYVKSLKSSSDL